MRPPSATAAPRRLFATEIDQWTDEDALRALSVEGARDLLNRLRGVTERPGGIEEADRGKSVRYLSLVDQALAVKGVVVRNGKVDTSASTAAGRAAAEQWFNEHVRPRYFHTEE